MLNNEISLLRERLLKAEAINAERQGELERAEARHAAECARAERELEHTRQIFQSEMRAANLITQQSGARLEGYLLRQPIQARPEVRGILPRAPVDLWLILTFQ